MTPDSQEVLKVTKLYKEKVYSKQPCNLVRTLGEAIPQSLKDLEFMYGKRMRRSSGRCKEGVNKWYGTSHRDDSALAGGVD